MTKEPNEKTLRFEDSWSWLKASFKIHMRWRNYLSLRATTHNISSNTLIHHITQPFFASLTVKQRKFANCNLLISCVVRTMESDLPHLSTYVCESCLLLVTWLLINHNYFFILPSILHFRTISWTSQRRPSYLSTKPSEKGRTPYSCTGSLLVQSVYPRFQVSLLSLAMHFRDSRAFSQILCVPSQGVSARSVPPPAEHGARLRQLPHH